nr:hypothetical protein [Acidobacteriota bacterium]
MKRDLTAAMFTVLFVFIGPCTLKARQSAASGPTPEETVAEIKKAAAELVKSDSASIKKPIFEYNENGKVLEYYLGGVKTASLELPADDPYLLLFEKEIQIEALRDLLKQKAPAEEQDYWGPPLAIAEQLLMDAARDIQTTGSKSELRAKLEGRSNLVDSAFTFLNLSIGRLAKDKGYTARRVGDRGPASDTFTVRIVTEPSGGRVRVLTWAKYIECSKLKQCGDTWPWRELVSESENMIGAYFYHAEWAGGRSNEDRIEVRNSSPLTFRPR